MGEESGREQVAGRRADEEGPGPDDVAQAPDDDTDQGDDAEAGRGQPTGS